MKHLLIIVLILTARSAFGQITPEKQAHTRAMLQATKDTVAKYQDVHAPVIAAKDAYKYIGKRVIVKDSLYSGTVINDTTLACQMGEKLNTPRLTLLFNSTINKHADMGVFNTFRWYRVTIRGIISGTKDAPVLILRGLGSNFAFDANMHGTTH